MWEQGKGIRDRSSNDNDRTRDESDLGKATIMQKGTARKNKDLV